MNAIDSGNNAEMTAKIDVGQIDMTGVSLVRHHLQQAHLAACYLSGGELHVDLMTPIVEQLYMTEREAADIVRSDIRAAMDAIDALECGT